MSGRMCIHLWLCRRVEQVSSVWCPVLSFVLTPSSLCNPSVRCHCRHLLRCLIAATGLNLAALCHLQQSKQMLMRIKDGRDVSRRRSGKPVYLPFILPFPHPPEGDGRTFLLKSSLFIFVHFRLFLHRTHTPTTHHKKLFNAHPTTPQESRKLSGTRQQARAAISLADSSHSHCRSPSGCRAQVPEPCLPDLSPARPGQESDQRFTSAGQHARNDPGGRRSLGRHAQMVRDLRRHRVHHGSYPWSIYYGQPPHVPRAYP